MRNPMSLASGSMTAMVPVSDFLPILSPTLPCALVTISRVEPEPSHSYRKLSLSLFGL